MRNMMLFYLKFPILSALRRKLTWTHFFYSNEFKKNQPAVDQISSLALLQSEKSIARKAASQRNFILSSSFKNHRDHREHREKWQNSVFSECSVVDYLCKILQFPRECDNNPIEQV